MIATTEFKPQIVNWPEDQYHADREHLSRGHLATFHESRRKFEGERVLFTAPPKKAKDYYDIGTLTHVACLEPNRLAYKFVPFREDLLSDDGGIRTKAAKDWRDEVRAAGAIPLKADQYAVVLACAESVKRTCGEWIDRAKAIEQTILWRDEETGLRCRCRPDWFIDVGECILAFDIKTGETVDEHAFRRDCESMRYFLQDAHYSAGVAKLTGKPVYFHFVTVEKSWPFRSRVFNLDEGSTVRAIECRRRILGSIADCMDTGDFSESWERSFTPLEIRPFAFA